MDFSVQQSVCNYSLFVDTHFLIYQYFFFVVVVVLKISPTCKVFLCLSFFSFLFFSFFFFF